MPDANVPRDKASFGHFVLWVGERRLEKDGAAIRLGGRALEILILLVRRAGEIVGRQALQDEVWPNVTVDPVSLRVQMTALRKALGAREAAGFVATIPGRGYCFVAPVTWEMADHSGPVQAAGKSLPKLPFLIGRDSIVAAAIAKLAETRFVTLAGPGGIGKTSIAITVAHALTASFSDGVHFFELSGLASAQAVLGLLRRDVLGRYSFSDRNTQPVAPAMRSKRALLVFDCCDRMTSGMAGLAADILEHADGVHVLATSREPLQAPGETVITPDMLAYPADPSDLSAESLLEFPAIRLVAERAGGIAADFRPGQEDLRAIARMAAQLDGLPLALDLAAHSIAESGITGTASLVSSRFALFLSNRSADQPRHESLNAALEWSHDQLTPEQRIIFRNVSVFAGFFTPDGIHAVAAEDHLSPQAVASAVTALSAKFLILQEAGDDTARYRLLDTTRAFALSKLLTFGEATAIKRRHAQYILGYLTDANATASGLSWGGNANRLRPHLDNVRAALEWCFSQNGDAALGARLAAASSRIFLILQLSSEGERWFKLALEALEEDAAGTRLELDLKFAISASKASAKQNAAEMLSELREITSLADRVGEKATQLEARAWECMNGAQARHGDESLLTALAARDIALSMDDYPAKLLGDWVLGSIHHLRGELQHVVPLCASASTLLFSGESVFFSSIQKTAQVCAMGSYARTLWLQGKPDAALQVAHAMLDGPGNPIVKRSNAAIFFAPLYIWAGDWQAAENLIAATLATVAIDEGDRLFLSALRGEMFLKRGDLYQATLRLQDFHDLFTDGQAFAQMAVFSTGLAEALALSGKFVAAREAIDAALAVAEMFGESFFAPELYRVMGLIMGIAPLSERHLAAAWFMRALECARRQGSLSFELRAATSLARWYHAAGQAEQAHAVLSPVYGRFTEGFETIDLTTARIFLDQLDTLCTGTHRSSALA